MVTAHVVRVFTDPNGHHGNPLGIIDNPADLGPDERQAIAKSLGYSETIFLDNPDKAEITIHNLNRQIPFAGHAAVGAAWMLARLTGHHPAVLRMSGGEAPSWTDDAGVWVRAPLAITPPWWAERLDDAHQIDTLTGPLDPTQDFTQLWAWIDEPAGTARMRTYATRVGIPEDEACGTGAMRLAAALGRHLTIHHGEGSIIHAARAHPATQTSAATSPRTPHARSDRRQRPKAARCRNPRSEIKCGAA